MQEDLLVNISKQLETVIDMLTEKVNEPHRTCGRPNKRHIIRRFRKKHPTYSKTQCVQMTGVSIKTVSKYWDA